MNIQLMHKNLVIFCLALYMIKGSGIHFRLVIWEKQWGVCNNIESTVFSFYFNYYLKDNYIYKNLIILKKND